MGFFQEEVALFRIQLSAKQHGPIIWCNVVQHPLSYGCLHLQLVFSIHQLHFTCSARNELIFSEIGLEMFGFFLQLESSFTGFVFI